MRTARLLPVSPSMHCAGGVSTPGGCLLPGGSALGRGIPACTEADPSGNRMTDRCKNITLPQTSFVGGKNQEGKESSEAEQKFRESPNLINKATLVVTN